MPANPVPPRVPVYPSRNVNQGAELSEPPRFEKYPIVGAPAYPLTFTGPTTDAPPIVILPDAMSSYVGCLVVHVPSAFNCHGHCEVVPVNAFTAPSVVNVGGIS